MHAELEAIVKLADVDAERDRVNKAIRERDAAKKAAEAGVAAAAQAVEGAKAALAAAMRKEHDANSRMTEAKHRQEQAKRALSGAYGSSAAAEKQLEQSAALADQAETDALSAMEEQDSLRPALKEYEAAHAAQKALLADLEARVPADIAALKAELARHDQARAVALAALSKDLQFRYDDVYKKRKTATARVVDGTCVACQRVVAAQHLTDLRRGASLEPCRGCGRWLVP